jgi:membrane associated rhomboid family serine protease
MTSGSTTSPQDRSCVARTTPTSTSPRTRRASGRWRAPADVFPLKDNIPTERTPFVTIALIAINVIVYLLFQKKTGVDISGNSLDQPSLAHYGAIPYELTHPGDHCDFVGRVVCEGQPGVSGHAEHQLPTIVTVFTSMFTHGGLLHLGGNMLFLWIFGNNVEDAMGHWRFIVFYLLAGIAALAGQTLLHPDSVAPTLGASGAIAGVLAGYLVLYPRARVLTVVVIILFFTVIELPAMLFLGIWFLQQMLFASLELTDPTGGGGGVAYFAHIGGFLFGLAAIKLFAQYTKEVTGGGPRFPVY